MGGVSLIAQTVGSLIAIVIALVGGFAVYLTLDKTFGIRLSKEDEMMGSDLAIHKLETNPEDASARFL